MPAAVVLVLVQGSPAPRCHLGSLATAVGRHPRHAQQLCKQLRQLRRQYSLSLSQDHRLSWSLQRAQAHLSSAIGRDLQLQCMLAPFVLQLPRLLTVVRRQAFWNRRRASLKAF